MNRVQAVNIIKEVSEQCPLLVGRSIKLLQTKGNNASSNTLQLHIKVSNDHPFLVNCVENVAEKHNLTTRQIDDYVIVYEPQPKK